MLLDREEYIEQNYFFKTLRQRLEDGGSTQNLLVSIRHELLATTKLPIAIDFMNTELKHTGGFHTAMRRLNHYFTPFQSYVIEEAENPDGRFDFAVALKILECEASYRAESPDVQGIFFYQFETLCRNRLKYDPGFAAMASDPIYDENWSAWIMTLRRQIGIMDFADMIYVRSEFYPKKPHDAHIPVLFGLREGKIAKANHRKDPLYLFSALQRHLGYPKVPRHRIDEEPEAQVPALRARIDQLQSRLDLLEEEVRGGGIDITRFYVKK